MLFIIWGQQKRYIPQALAEEVDFADLCLPSLEIIAAC